MRGFGTALVLGALVFGCASLPYKEVPPPEVDAGHATVPPAETPEETIGRLLEESESDSCPVCARETRKRAFAIAERRFPPGAGVTSDDSERFWLLPGDPNTLALGSSAPVHPRIVFRFHTRESRLIGVNSNDLTSDAIAAPILSKGPGPVFRGSIEILPYAYGDGLTFIFQRTSGRIVVMCRIVKRLQQKPGFGKM